MLKYRRTKRESVKKIFLLISALLIQSTVIAEERIFDAGRINTQSVPLTEYISVLEDPGGSLSFNDISGNKYSSVFRPAKSSDGALNFSFSSSAFWLRFKIKNTDSSVRELRAVISYPRLEYIDFYCPEINGYRTVHSGYSVPQSERPEKSRFFIFPFTVRAGAEEVFYFRISSRNAVNIPISLWKKMHITVTN